MNFSQSTVFGHGFQNGRSPTLGGYPWCRKLLMGCFFIGVQNVADGQQAGMCSIQQRENLVIGGVPDMTQPRHRMATLERSTLAGIA
ncbi:MAG TPA: hypothetical protein DCS88_11090 [Alphaproteobacteria bacterium]|nr:hypothetical protein [Alphaproteobacteria bacterium]